MEDARQAGRRATAVEAQVSAAVEQLEKAHVELHRRSESLRQKTRTLYLIDRVLTLDATTDDPRAAGDGLLALVGDDMQRPALLAPAARARGEHALPRRGAWHRAEHPAGLRGSSSAKASRERWPPTREPLLVQDVAEAKSHPLLRDEYFTTGSFISFPLVYHGELVGVVNLTNRAHAAAIFVEEDVERVRLLGLVIALVATHARLAERLLEIAECRLARRRPLQHAIRRARRRRVARPPTSHGRRSTRSCRGEATAAADRRAARRACA